MTNILGRREYIVNVCIRLEKANVHQCAIFLYYCTIYLNLVVPICILENLMYYGNPPYLYCKLWINAPSRQKQSYDLCGSLCYWQARAPFLIAIYIWYFRFLLSPTCYYTCTFVLIFIHYKSRKRGPIRLGQSSSSTCLTTH